MTLRLSVLTLLLLGSLVSCGPTNPGDAPSRDRLPVKTQVSNQSIVYTDTGAGGLRLTWFGSEPKSGDVCLQCRPSPESHAYFCPGKAEAITKNIEYTLPTGYFVVGAKARVFGATVDGLSNGKITVKLNNRPLYVNGTAPGTINSQNRACDPSVGSPVCDGGSSGVVVSAVQDTVNGIGWSTDPSIKNTLTLLSDKSTYCVSHAEIELIVTERHIQASKTKLDFKYQQVGTTNSATQTFNVTNDGGATLKVSNITVSEGFERVKPTDAELASNGGIEVKPTGQSGATPLVVEVRFSPKKTGDFFTGALTITSDAVNLLSPIALSGTSVQAATRVVDNASRTLNFEDVRATDDKLVTLKLANVGDKPLTLNPTFSDDPASMFSVMQGGTVLSKIDIPAGAETSVQVNFHAPDVLSQTVVKTLDLNVTAGDLADNKQTLTLNATVSKPVLEPALNQNTLDFETQRVGVAKNRTVTVRNTGTRDIVITSIGDAQPASAFKIKNKPVGAQTLKKAGSGSSADSTLTLSVDFTPQEGSNTGSITLGSADPEYGSYPIKLQGLGNKPVLSPASGQTLNFGAQRAGKPFRSTFTVTNTGNYDLTFTSISNTTAPFQIVDKPSSKTLTGDNSENSKLTLTVEFTPPTDTESTSTQDITLLSGDKDYPSYVIKLRGSAYTPRIDSIDPVTFGEVVVGTAAPASKSVTIRNSGSGPVKFKETYTEGGLAFSLTRDRYAELTVNPGTTQVTVLCTPDPDQAGKGPLNGVLKLVSEDTGVGVNGTVSANLSCTPVAPSPLVNPTRLDFSDQNAGNPIGETKEVSVSNSGSGTLRVSASTGSSEFKVSPASLDVTASNSPQKFAVKFLPQAAGLFSGNLTLTTNAPATPSLTLPLSGNGKLLVNVDVEGTTDPSKITFPPSAVGAPISRNVTLSTNGSKDILVESPEFSPGASPPFTTNFAAANNNQTVLTLGPNKRTFTFKVFFTPDKTEEVTGTLTLKSSAANGPLSFQLSGEGAAPRIKLWVLRTDGSETQEELEFGTLSVGSSTEGSRTAQVIVKNTGTADLTIQRPLIDFSGPGTAPFSVSQPPATGTVLGRESTLTLNVKFEPTENGRYEANLRVRSNATNDTSTSPFIKLKGNSLSPEIKLTPSSLDFKSQKVKGSSDPQFFTIKNLGQAELKIYGLIKPTGYEIVPPTGLALPTNSSPWTVRAYGETNQIGVIFNPQQKIPLNGFLTVSSNAPQASGNTNVNTLGLTGTGVDGTGVLTPNTRVSFTPTNVLDSDFVDFTLKNEGNAPLFLKSASIIDAPEPRPFTILNFEAGRTLLSGESSNFRVEFRPTYNGNPSANLVIETDSALESNIRVFLSGRADGPEISLTNGDVISFGEVDVQSTVRGELMVKNGGSGRMTIREIGFTARTDGGTNPTYDPNEIFNVEPLADGGRRLPLEVGTTPIPIPITFKPNKMAKFEAQVTLRATNARDVPATVKGEGIAPVLIVTEPGGTTALDKLNFPGVLLDQYSAAQRMELKNIGTAPLTVTKVEMTSNGADVFFLEPKLTEAFTLPAKTSKTISVQFKPTAQRNSADVVLTFRTSNEAVVSSASVNLIGQGVAEPLGFERQMEFGKQLINNTVGRKLRITNALNKDTNLLRASIDSGVGCTQFVPQLSASLLLPALKEGILEVKFLPLGPGSVTCTMRLDFGLGDKPAVTLHGEGISSVLAFNDSKSELKVDFGSLRASSERRVEQFLLTNRSDEKITLSEPEVVSTTGEPFKLDPPLKGVSIEPNAVLQVNVEYQPTGETLSKTLLKIGTSTPQLQRPLELQLLGTATKKVLELSTTYVNFGSVEVNTPPEQRSITIKNTSAQDQRVIVSMERPEDPVFSTDVGSSGLDIPAQGSASFQVMFKPQAAGEVENEVLIRLQDSQKADVVLPVNGVGRTLTGRGNGVGCSAGGAWGSTSLLALLALSGLRSRRRRRE